MRTTANSIILALQAEGFNFEDYESFLSQLSYRVPQRVTEVLAFNTSIGETTYPICPRCRITLEREYQSYCDRCGQCLEWKHFSQATVLHAPLRDY